MGPKQTISAESSVEFVSFLREAGFLGNYRVALTFFVSFLGQAKKENTLYYEKKVSLRPKPIFIKK